jgi:MFS transporter, putative metabolite:H+ symporter
MFEILDRRTSLTGNQIKILTAAIIGDALEFFDYFLIGFVLAFLIGPWKLTFGQSATVLMSSGIGAIMGAYAWGLARRPHRPPQGLHRHRAELLHRYRPLIFYAG